MPKPGGRMAARQGGGRMAAVRRFRCMSAPLVAVGMALTAACPCVRKVQVEEQPEVIFVPIDVSEQLPLQMGYEPRPAGRPVTTITREMRRLNWLAAAEALRRAVELADGGGILAPFTNVVLRGRKGRNGR